MHLKHILRFLLVWVHLQNILLGALLHVLQSTSYIFVFHPTIQIKLLVFFLSSSLFFVRALFSIFIVLLFSLNIFATNFPNESSVYNTVYKFRIQIYYSGTLRT